MLSDTSTVPLPIMLQVDKDSDICLLLQDDWDHPVPEEDDGDDGPPARTNTNNPYLLDLEKSSSLLILLDKKVKKLCIMRQIFLESKKEEMDHKNNNMNKT